MAENGEIPKLGNCGYCTDVFDAFRYATEDLDQRVFTAASYGSIWINLIERGTYPKNVGTNRSVFAIGDIEPVSGAGSWTPINMSGTEAGGSMDTPTEICCNDWKDIEWGFDELTYGPEISQLRGPVICRKDLSFSHEPGLFLSAYIQKAGVRARRQWERWLEYWHIFNSRKVVAVADFDTAFYDQTGLTGMECPDCELTQEMLEIIAGRLIEDGATQPDGNGFIELGPGGPMFSLHIGTSQSMRILRQNASLREDYRFADPSTLIARIGASRVIGNFRHIINQRPRRYTCLAGTFTEVLPYVTATDLADLPTKGTKQIPNVLWRSAPYESADILSTKLYTCEVVPPTNSAGGVSFDPVSYMGQWQFVNGAYKWDRLCPDPLGDKGRHFAEFIAAARPNPVARFRYGYHIIYKRCLNNVVECTTCSS